MTEPKKWPYSFSECCAKDLHQFWIADGNFRQPVTQCQNCGCFLGRSDK